MIIAITGTPCTGKTTAAELLAKRIGYDLIPFNEIAKKYDTITGYDKEMESEIVDIDKLKRNVKKFRKNRIIDGHLSHELPVDLVFVLRCNPETLKNRLINRYPENLKKVKENVDSEILGVITSEAINSNENVYEIDVTGKETYLIVEEIIKVMDENFKGQHIFVDWSEKFSDWLI